MLELVSVPGREATMVDATLDGDVGVECNTGPDKRRVFCCEGFRGMFGAFWPGVVNGASSAVSILFKFPKRQFKSPPITGTSFRSRNSTRKLPSSLIISGSKKFRVLWLNVIFNKYNRR